MSPSYDFVQDNLEHMESQGFKYFLVLIDQGEKNSKEKDKVVIYTTLEEGEMEEIIKTIRENSNKKRHVRKSKSKKKSDNTNL